ncbi:hypothetical protein J7I00_004646 [Vibrio parahaemolyticus]|nr:hypothetical protein [Vibrio parahaemolyticus]
MASEIYRDLLMQKISKLRLEFESSESIFKSDDGRGYFHNGEFGSYRESAVVELLEMCIPQTFGITDGFIIDSEGHKSTQCDIIIYDKSNCPKLADSSYKSFIPVEAVVAVGEVKSKIQSVSEMQGILEKLSRVKSLKNHVKNPMLIKKFKNKDEDNGKGFDSLHYRLDSIFTFVLCKSFPSMPKEGYYYDEAKTQLANKHNFIASLDSGHCCYIFRNIFNYYYPQTFGCEHDQVYKQEIDDKVTLSIGLLVTSLFNHCNNATLINFDPTIYVGNVVINS